MITVNPSEPERRAGAEEQNRAGRESLAGNWSWRLQFDRLDHDKLSHRSLVEELDPSGDLGEQSIVLAAPYVQPGLHPRAALANNDRSAGDDLSAECLESQSLRVRVAPVT